ncbi:MAG: ATP-binding protein [Phycisphaerae bacterium]|nr:ATP-binding protein [Phycisphaerae bacterium]
MAELFDPLESATQSSDEVVSSARKREIKNILKSYVGFYDPFSELIQNAMDAVDERKRRLQEDNYDRHVWIEVNFQANSFSVTDNGIGFSEPQFKTFLAPNITFKPEGTTRGRKGVGATYLAYGFNFLQLSTKTPDYHIVAEFKNGREWVDDSEGIVDRPVAVDSSVEHSLFEDVDRGSTFTIKFIGDNIRPKDMSWISARTPEQWAAVLLIKTPLGHISLDGEEPNPILFDISVIDRNGNRSELIERPARYIFPHIVITSSVPLDDILAEQERRLKKGLDISKLPDKFKQLNGVYKYLSTDEIVEALKRSEESAALTRQFGITAYGFFCYSVKIWDQFSDEVLKLRKGSRILRGGLQLATDHMPQGDLLTIPLTSNIGYQNQSHVVVHFKNADPDLGRKGFQPELKRVAEEISVVLVNTLKKWRSNLKKDTGAAPSIVGQGNLHEWIKRQEKHEEEAPLEISNNNFFLPTREISITAVPCSEQDVIVLFNQLIAGGVIRGIKLLATSQHEKYDSIFRYYVSEQLANHVFDKERNPLGVQELRHNEPYRSKPYVLEYKYNLDALIQEFETEEKHEEDVNLLVAWDIGSEWRRRYVVTSLLALDNIQHRIFHGLTHIFRDENSGDIRFYGIILSELIDYLNDVDGVQEFHRDTYGETI